MILQPARPIREFRFALTYRKHGGEEVQYLLTPEQDGVMEGLLKQFEQFFDTPEKVDKIVIEVGDRQETHILPTDNISAGGMNTLSDVR